MASPYVWIICSDLSPRRATVVRIVESGQEADKIVSESGGLLLAQPEPRCRDIRVGDLKYPQSPFNADRCQEIENHIDEAIDHATGPVVRVGGTRSGWTLSEIEHVLGKYRAAGWDVIGGDRDFLAILRVKTA